MAKRSPAPAPEPDSSSSSVLEDTCIDLLAGPFDKVSITIPSALRACIAERADERGLSAYVAEVLAREERRLRLIEFLDAMDEEFGPPTDEEMARTQRQLEDMWARFDTRSSAQRSSTPAR